MNNMWIVVVVDEHYPSVFHFKNEEDARESYEKERGMGFIVHLAEVKDSKIDHNNTSYNFDEDNIESYDVEWYTNK